MKKNTILTFLFACIPGAGQMYLGYMKRGISIMIGLVIAVFVFNNLSSTLAITIPVFFAFSFFDTWHIRNQTQEHMYVYKDQFIFDIGDSFSEFTKKHAKILGWGFILFAVLLLMNDMISPLLRHFFDIYYITNILNSFVVSVLLILLGIYLLKGGKKANVLKAGDYVNYNANSNATYGATNYNTLPNGNNMPVNVHNNEQQNNVFTHNFMCEQPPQNTNVMQNKPEQIYIPPQDANTQIQQQIMQQETAIEPPIVENAPENIKAKTKSKKAKNEQTGDVQDEWYNRQ